MVVDLVVAKNNPQCLRAAGLRPQANQLQQTLARLPNYKGTPTVAPDRTGAPPLG